MRFQASKHKFSQTLPTGMTCGKPSTRVAVAEEILMGKRTWNSSSIVILHHQKSVKLNNQGIALEENYIGYYACFTHKKLAILTFRHRASSI